MGKGSISSAPRRDTRGTRSPAHLVPASEELCSGLSRGAMWSKAQQKSLHKKGWEFPQRLALLPVIQTSTGSFHSYHPPWKHFSSAGMGLVQTGSSPAIGEFCGHSAGYFDFDWSKVCQEPRERKRKDWKRCTTKCPLDLSMHPKNPALLRSYEEIKGQAQRQTSQSLQGDRDKEGHWKPWVLSIFSYSEKKKNNSPYILVEGMEMLIHIATQTGDPQNTSTRPTETPLGPLAQHLHTACKSINVRGLEKNSGAHQWKNC